MRRRAVAVIVLALSLSARAEPQLESAIRALRKDSSLKVRTQAAIVLGQSRAAEAVPALREAVAKDDCAAVRLAAVGALAKIRDRSARATLRTAADADPDDAVRKAAARAADDLGPVAFSIEEADGAGGAGARGALRDALARQLRDRGFDVVEQGGMRLKPSVVALDVGADGGKTVIAVKASLVAVDGDGRMAAMLQGAARLSARGTLSQTKIGLYSAKALEAAARALCDDLAARLGER
jgi:HEAT repeats